jgi:hypothetical protein
MPTPSQHASDVAVAFVGGTAGASLGSVIGIPVEALIAGVFGGLVAVFMFPSRRAGATPPKQGLPLYVSLAASVLISVTVAGFLGPLTAAWFNAPTIPDHVEVKAFAFLWGAGAQAGLLVSAIRALRRRIDQLGGGSS